MPLEQQLAHRVFRDPAFPYISNTTPLSTDPYFASGSSDILTSIANYAQRRPGFADNVEVSPTVFNNLQRLFTWDRFDGSFYIMACDISSNRQAIVYKYAVGVDTSFSPIWIDMNNTPFDFVTSNNTVYFGNGVTMKKWDPVNGVSNWGIANGSGSSSVAAAGAAANNAVANTVAVTMTATVLADGGGAHVWTIVGTTANQTLAAGVNSNRLNNTGFGFAIPSSGTITGITVQPNVKSTGLGIETFEIRLLKAGVATGSDLANFENWPNPAGPITYGGNLNLWGEAAGFWLFSDINNANFGVEFIAFNNAGGGRLANVNSISITVYYTTPALPAWTITAAGGPYSASIPPTTNYLDLTTYGFGISAAVAVVGIEVQVTGHVTPAADVVTINAALLSQGARIGGVRTGNLSIASDTTVTMGSSSDLWASNWTSALVNDPSFGVELQASASSLATLTITSVAITIFFAVTPVVTLVGTGLTATTGFQYVICYGNSNTGHVSSPSAFSHPVSKPVNQSMEVTLATSTDPQVNQIRVFRTTDSASGLGGQSYFEIPNSPFPNIGWTFTSVANAVAGSTVYTGTSNGASGFASSIGQSFLVAGFTNGANNGTFAATAASATTLTLSNAGGVAETHAATGTLVAIDGATDLQLNIYSVAPLPTFNDPPLPGRGMVYFSGRIWFFTGNKVWFTGLEEITVGVPEECVPSGIAGNFWSFDQPVQGLGVAGNGNNQGLGILCGGRIYGITGNTLDTFRRMTISNRRGTRSLTSISSMGGMCTWLDSANQIWVTDGSNMQELSIPIRPDIANVVPANCSATFHSAGTFHWLVFSTGTKLFVYDMDTEQWMPPWNFAATYLFSGETSPGNYVLMASNGTQAIQLNPNKFNDNGTTYAPVLKTNLMSVVPDFGKRFSYIGQGMYDEPSRTGVPYAVEIDTNNVNTLSDVLFQVDDDPTTATYTSIYANKQPADVTWNRTANAVNVIQNVFTMNQPSCRWFSTEMILRNTDTLDKIYSYFLVYKNLGGR